LKYLIITAGILNNKFRFNFYLPYSIPKTTGISEFSTFDYRSMKKRNQFSAAISSISMIFALKSIPAGYWTDSNVIPYS